MVATGYEGCGHCPACREGHIDQCEEIRNDTEDGYNGDSLVFQIIV